jgi:hypothetical protein
METQPGRRPAEASTPMADASSKASQVTGKSSVLSRNQADAARKRSLKKQRSMLSK